MIIIIPAYLGKVLLDVLHIYVEVTKEVKVGEGGFAQLATNAQCEMVFCCIVASIQPDISGCQQDFAVV